MKEFGHRQFHLVLLENGRPGFVINQWIYYLLENGITESLLEEKIRSVMHLYEYTIARYGKKTLSENEARTLIKNFLEAKKRGTIDADGNDLLGLYWKPLRKRTVCRYLAAINDFDKWQSTFHGAKRLNPSEIEFMNAWETFHEFRKRTNWDVLLHLFPSKVHTKETYQNFIRESHSRFQINRKSFPKCFPISAFVDLVDKSRNPRDKMLWLLMFGIGLRQSEPLHLYLQDCAGITEYGETRVRLDDPEFGMIEWTDKSGEPRQGTRKEYLKSMFDNERFKYTLPLLYKIAPRNTYGGKGGMFAGYKGMSFDYDNDYTGRVKGGYEACWIDPRIGVYFQKCLIEYLEKYFYGRQKDWPFHPFLFIQIDRENLGMPMSMPSIKKAWSRALKRIGMGNLGMGPHSLRHLCGYYCASKLKLNIEMTKSILRHANISSTQVYYHLSASEVRKTIINAVGTDLGINIRDYIVDDHSPDLEIPDYWAPGYTTQRTSNDD